jgi:molecular chaperone HscB
VKTTDYFEYLGLPQKLRIDPGDLERRFYELSRRLHPDRHVQASGGQRVAVEEAAATLNDAYRTLKDPVSRAGHLLHLEGIKQPEAPADLVEEAFEARAGGGRVEAQARFRAMAAEAERELVEAFAEWDESGRRESLQRIAGILSRRRYVRKLLEELDT